MLTYMVTNKRTGATLAHVNVLGFDRAAAIASRDRDDLIEDVIENVSHSMGDDLGPFLRIMLSDMVALIQTGKEYHNRVITYRLEDELRVTLTTKY